MLRSRTWRYALSIGLSLLPSRQASAQRATQAIAPRAVTMAGRSVVYAPNGVAATSQPLATTAALRMSITIMATVLSAGGR